MADFESAPALCKPRRLAAPMPGQSTTEAHMKHVRCCIGSNDREAIESMGRDRARLSADGLRP